MVTNNPRIIFFGTSHFAVPALEKLVEAGMSPVLVITQPDAPVGRKKILTPSPVKEAAKRLELPVETPVNLKTVEATDLLRKTAPDIFILAAYGKIIPKTVLEIPQRGSLNIHPSLLPLFRGASPIHAAILSGSYETGVTLIEMDDQLDHGPIVAQKSIALDGTEYYSKLSQDLAHEGASLLVQTLPDYAANKTGARIQDHVQATFTKLIRPTDAKISWERDAIAIERSIRAYHLWPTAHTYWKIRPDHAARINILQARVEQKEFSSGRPGYVQKNLEALAVETGKGVLIVERLQLAGRKETDSKTFLRGHPQIFGSQLGEVTL